MLQILQFLENLQFILDVREERTLLEKEHRTN